MNTKITKINTNKSYKKPNNTNKSYKKPNNTNKSNKNINKKSKKCSSRKAHKKLTGIKYDCKDDCVISKKIPTISESQLKVGKVIGEGNFGQVVIAEATCPNSQLNHMKWCPPNKTVNVVLKELKAQSQKEGQPNTSVEKKNNDTGEAKNEFINEINVTWELSRAKIVSKNIVKMYGVVMDGLNPKYLVLEHCPIGSLESYLQDTTKKMSQTLALHLLKNIVGGMMYVHEIGYVHRDLAARNVLLVQDNNYSFDITGKIGDFGLARPKELKGDDYVYQVSGNVKMKIPIRWTSPSAITGLFSEKSDLWAFGITACEIYMRAKVPYSNTMHNSKLIASNQEVQEYINQPGNIHARPETCPSQIYDILVKCWKNDEDSICSFYQLYKMIKDMNKLETKAPDEF